MRGFDEFKKNNEVICVEIGVENIVVKSNPRTDFGDIDELAASIKEKGVIEPVVVKETDGKYELVSGERRVRAAKAAGLKEVPATVYKGDDNDVEEVKLIENIQRKDLNPVEEGEAFQAYLSNTKASIETLAQKISKPKIYVERRIALLSLTEQVKKALFEGKIALGHALLIARLKTDKEQASLLKRIVREKMSVSEAERSLQYEDTTVRLEYAQFDKAGCKGCMHNGGEQAMLFESGSKIKGICLDKKCFFKKQKVHNQKVVRKLQKQGIKVLSQEKVMQIKKRERVSTWDDDYKKIMKKLPKEPENYVVVFEQNHYGGLDKEVWCINPPARHPKRKEQESKKKASNALDRLKTRVAEHKREFLIARTRERVSPGSKESKALTLFTLLVEANDWCDHDRRDAAMKIMRKEKLGVTSYGTTEPRFSKIMALEEKDIDRLIAEVSGLWVKRLRRELNDASAAFGVSLREHFVLSEDYLTFHTKDQLVALAKEIGLDKHLEAGGNEKWDKAKKADMVKSFLESGFDLKGKVPKVLEKAG